MATVTLRNREGLGDQKFPLITGRGQRSELAFTVLATVWKFDTEFDVKQLYSVIMPRP